MLEVALFFAFLTDITTGTVKKYDMITPFLASNEEIIFIIII